MYDEEEFVSSILDSQKPVWENMIFSVMEEDGLDIDDFIDAAEGGLDGAQFIVGIAYLYGIEVRRNYDKAVKWLSKAARQGLGYAEYHLGMCYSAGLGVAQDIDEAIRWVRKSKKHGVEGADIYLRMLEDLQDL